MLIYRLSYFNTKFYILDYNIQLHLIMVVIPTIKNKILLKYLSKIKTVLLVTRTNSTAQNNLLSKPKTPHHHRSPLRILLHNPINLPTQIPQITPLTIPQYQSLKQTTTSRLKAGSIHSRCQNKLINPFFIPKLFHHFVIQYHSKPPCIHLEY